MKNSDKSVTYTFVNPNTPDDVKNVIKEIIIEKLLSIRTEKLQVPNYTHK